MKNTRFKMTTLIIAVMALLSVFIIWSIINTIDLKKEIEGLKFELIRVHNEVVYKTDKMVEDMEGRKSI